MFSPTDPPVLLAQIVYCCQSDLSVGVPEIVPLLSSAIPSGSEGEASQVSILGPSLFTGILIVSLDFSANSLSVQ